MPDQAATLDESVGTPSRQVLRRKSVATRYLRVVLSLLTVALTITLGITVWGRYQSELQTLEEDTRSQAAFVSSVSPEAVFFQDFLTLETLVRQTTSQVDVVYAYFVDTSGSAMTRYLDLDQPQVASAMSDDQVFDIQVITDEILESSLVSELRYPIISEGVSLGELVIGFSAEHARETAKTFALFAVVAALIILFFLVLLTTVVFEWLVQRPLHHLTRSADRFAAGALNDRVVVDRSDEIGVLQSAFNEMADELQTTLAGLALARDEAQSADRAKSEFLANMSHEIRTPLNAVLGLTDLVLQSDLDDHQRDLLTTMHHSGDALLEMINEILDLSKLSSGPVTVEARPFDLRRTVGSITDLFIAEAGLKQLELNVAIDNDIPSRVVGDENRLRQVLVNLVGNAVKFTERGSATVHVSSPPTGAGRVRFEVTDTGIGIDPARQGELFEPFQQGDSSTTRRYGGTGLGLAICKGLVEAMQGELEATGSLGVGSTFFFTIPLPADQGRSEYRQSESLQYAERIDTDMAQRHPLRILLAEDNLVNQKVALLMLGQLGYTADVVGDGARAVELAVTNTYDVVLMDIQMPLMDGLEASRQIHESLPEDKWPMLVAFTAHALEGARQQYLDNGMQHHIAKPVRIEVLAAVLEAAVAIHPPLAPQATENSTAPKGPTSAHDPRTDHKTSDHPFDINALHERFGEDAAEVMSEILPIFFEESQELLQRIESGIENEHYEELVATAHTLKGSALNMGINRLGAVCEQIEFLARDESVLGADALLQVARAEFERAENAEFPI